VSRRSTDDRSRRETVNPPVSPVCSVGYAAANVMLTRYKGPLKLKDWAFAIAKRSTRRKARIALGPSSRHYYACHAATRHRVQTGVAGLRLPDRRSSRTPERSDARGREQMTAPIL
jgi:hypothetical protein